MGTRNLTMVHLHGELKVAQYGQWDGYPSGQGKDIAEILRGILAKKGGLADFISKVDKLYFGTEEAIEKLCKVPDWTKVHPEFSRDTGGKILGLIAEGKVKVLHNSHEFLKDGTFCEWAYDVDLTTETVTVYQGTSKWKVLTFKEFIKPNAMKKLMDEANKEAENG
jgi:hypothetical protein